jgi:C4-dicarboxylate transporter DctM subunit
MIGMMFVVLGLFLLLGAPVSFAIGISAMSFVHAQGFPTLAIMAQRMVEGVDSFALMALPLFILSGEIMAYGSTPRLMRLANMLIGRIPGGLGAAACVGCGFFGAISGSGVATTVAVGGIMAPEMVRKGYGRSFTASLVAGAGVLGMIIPPSFCMVLYGASGGVSIGAMFMAGFIPGFLAIFSLIVYSVIVGKIRGYKEAGGRPLTLKERAAIVCDALLPLFMPVIILGGVLSGVVTPTECAAVASVYSFILAAFVYKEITAREMIKICSRSTISTAIVMLIISMAAPFGWIMAMNAVPALFATTVMSVASEPLAVTLLVTAVMLVLGTFMDGNSLIILLTPILLPLMTNLGLDPVHFGIIMMMSMAVGGITPPLALSLFVSVRIVGIKVEETFPEILYVVAILVFVTLLIVFIPDIAMWLPRTLGIG